MGFMAADGPGIAVAPGRAGRSPSLVDRVREEDFLLPASGSGLHDVACISGLIVTGGGVRRGDSGVTGSPAGRAGG